MNNIVKVVAPLFYVSKDNPYCVSYNQILSDYSEWKSMVVGSFGGKLPTIKDYEIFYYYEGDRGCIIDGRQYRNYKINKLINKLKIKNVNNYGTCNWN